MADFFVVPPAAGSLALPGIELEEVRFVRDEMADMAWGIERIVQNGVGEPWPANERSPSTPDPGPPPELGIPLTYRIQTPVPEQWIPFVPVVVDQNRRVVQLERGVVLQPEGTPPPAPAGRILLPTRLGEENYGLDESEVPRDGVRVARAYARARWVDGSTQVWIGRRATLGAGEERSGLLFDQAVVTPGSG